MAEDADGRENVADTIKTESDWTRNEHDNSVVIETLNQLPQTYTNASPITALWMEMASVPIISPSETQPHFHHGTHTCEHLACIIQRTESSSLPLLSTLNT